MYNVWHIFRIIELNNKIGFSYYFVKLMDDYIQLIVIVLSNFE